MTTPAASKKDRHGNRTYSIPHPVTRELIELPSWSRLKNLMYSGGLETWKLKKVAAAVAMSPALQMQAADPESAYKAVKKALEADTEKADVGTYVHKYTEQIDDGSLDWDFVPEAAKPYIEHYQRLKAEWAWEAVEAEVTIYNLTLGYAGSADRFCRFPGLPALLELPNPDDDVFPVDIKTGESIWAETALQLGAYSGGEGIFEAPSKVALGFTAREAQIEDDIRNGVGFDRINPNRRKWSDDAVREARAEIEAEWWKAYAEHGKFRPMPAGLRRDVGLVVHLRADGARLVPLRLDGDPKAGLVPASYVIDGLTALYRWSRRKDVIGEAIQFSACSVASGTAPKVEQDPADVNPETALDTLERAGLLEGAAVADSVDDIPASEEDKKQYLDWLADMASDRRHLLPALRQRLDAAGLTKKLRQDDWTLGELRRWSQCAMAVERAGRR